jgi:hypothetical protein
MLAVIAKPFKQLVFLLGVNVGKCGS